MSKLCKSTRRRIRRAAGEDGFTAVEFVVVVALIAVLTVILLPRFASLLTVARQSETRQDALAIGAAIELLIIEKTYDPADARLLERVRERAGIDFDGAVTELSADGSFLYSREVNGAVYAARYAASTGGVTDAMGVVGDDAPTVPYAVE